MELAAIARSAILAIKVQREINGDYVRRKNANSSSGIGNVRVWRMNQRCVGINTVRLLSNAKIHCLPHYILR